MTWHCIVLVWGAPLAVWFAFKVYGRRRTDHPQASREPQEPPPNQRVPRRTRRQLARGLVAPEPYNGNGVLSKPEHIIKERRD
jgi:hypothetical protein